MLENDSEGGIAIWFMWYWMQNPSHIVVIWQCHSVRLFVVFATLLYLVVIRSNDTNFGWNWVPYKKLTYSFVIFIQYQSNGYFHSLRSFQYIEIFLLAFNRHFFNSWLCQFQKTSLNDQAKIICFQEWRNDWVKLNPFN